MTSSGKKEDNIKKNTLVFRCLKLEHPIMQNTSTALQEPPHVSLTHTRVLNHNSPVLGGSSQDLDTWLISGHSWLTNGGDPNYLLTGSPSSKWIPLGFEITQLRNNPYFEFDAAFNKNWMMTLHNRILKEGW